MTDSYLNYDNGKRTDKGQALNKIQQGYESIARDNGEDTTKPTMAENLKRQYDNGYELSGMQLLIVGQFERDLHRQEIDEKKLREAEGHHHNE